MTRKLKSDFWTFKVHFIHSHHVEPRVNLYMPRKEESVPIPLRYIGVTYKYDLGCDALAPHRPSWEYRKGPRFIRRVDTIHILEKSPDWCTWSAQRLTKKQITPGPITCGQRYGKLFIFVVNGYLSCQEFGVGTKTSEIQRSSCAPRWYCERWFRLLRSIYLQSKVHLRHRWQLQKQWV